MLKEVEEVWGRWTVSGVRSLLGLKVIGDAVSVKCKDSI